MSVYRQRWNTFVLNRLLTVCHVGLVEETAKLAFENPNVPVKGAVEAAGDHSSCKGSGKSE